LFLCGLLVDNVQHLLLDCFFLEYEPIFVPDKIRGFRVISMSLHAALEQRDDVAIVRILSESKPSAVVHELFELLWMVLAKLLNFDFFLLLLDVGIFLSF